MRFQNDACCEKNRQLIENGTTLSATVPILLAIHPSRCHILQSNFLHSKYGSLDFRVKKMVQVNLVSIDIKATLTKVTLTKVTLT